MGDILFKAEKHIFSYRVSGILIHNHKVLLQRPKNDTAFAFPGGHVAFGETNEETLIREFKEEMNAEIKVDSLQWVGELFFPWGERECHQISLYYKINLTADSGIPLDKNFWGTECLEDHSFKLEFLWIDIDTIDQIELYPPQAKKYLAQGMNGMKHFVYKEQ